MILFIYLFIDVVFLFLLECLLMWLQLRYFSYLFEVIHMTRDH